MKKIEVIIYVVVIVALAFLYKKEIIDEASIGLAVGLVAAIKGLVYQKEKINALQHDLEQSETLNKTLQKK